MPHRLDPSRLSGPIERATPWQSSSKSANLSVSPDAAWNIVDRFMRADIRVFSFIKENRIEGPVRTVISEGLEQPELNITVDPEHMYASYALLESPFWKATNLTYHHGCMRVFDTGDGRCRFEWITDVASLRIPGRRNSAVSTWTRCGLNWSRSWRPARRRLGPRMP